MLLKQTLLYLPAQILAPTIQFIAILVWAKLLTPTDLGVVTLVIASQEVCFAACFGWWQRYTLRFINSFGPDSGRLDYLRTEMFAMAASIVLQTAIITPVLISTFRGSMSPMLLAITTAFMITRSLNNYQSERARADARIALYSIIQICGPVIGFVVGLLIIWRFGSTPVAVFGGFCVAQLFGLAAGVAMSDFGRAFGRPSVPILKTAVTFGGAVMLASMLAIMAINAPRFIVNRELGIAAVGMFAVGYSLGLRASSFAVTLVTAGAYPMVVRKMEREGLAAAYEQLSKNMVMVAVSVMPVAFGLLGVNRSVVGILVAAKFKAATLTILPFSTMGGLFRYIRAHTSDQVFLVSLKPHFSTMIAVVDIIVAVISAFVGLKLLGLAGAALGPMISGMVTLTGSFVLSRTRFGFHAPIASFARILAASSAMCAVLWVLPVARHAWMLGAYVALGAAIYVGLLFLLMPKERRILIALIERRTGRTQAAAA